ncbi:unnamed protein product, partial [Mesorhabditis spiculigera]
MTYDNSIATCSYDEPRQPTATQILGVAIQKRRSLNKLKERDYYRELLHTATIQNLCKHLGERRRAKRRTLDLTDGDGAPSAKKGCTEPSVQKCDPQGDANKTKPLGCSPYANNESRMQTQDWHHPISFIRCH